MTISVTVKTTKENGASVTKDKDGDKTTVEVPKESEQVFHVWGDDSLIIRETDG